MSNDTTPEGRETPEQRAREFLRGFDWNDYTTEYVDTIHDDLSGVIREAEMLAYQRGQEAMRQRCGDVVLQLLSQRGDALPSDADAEVSFRAGTIVMARKIEGIVRTLPIQREGDDRAGQATEQQQEVRGE